MCWRNWIVFLTMYLFPWPMWRDQFFYDSKLPDVVFSSCVSVPPHQVMILNERGDPIKNYILGPYLEGQSINITCLVTGGKYRWQSLRKIYILPS